MSRAIRSVSTERGHDVRDFALFAFGGAGPLHACDLARDCGIKTVVVPLEPGTLCARGILLSDINMDFVRSELSIADPAAWARACATLADMRVEAGAWLDREAVADGSREIRVMIDARYDGQNFEVTVPLDTADPAGLDDVFERFRRRHVEQDRLRRLRPADGDRQLPRPGDRPRRQDRSSPAGAGRPVWMR